MAAITNRELVPTSTHIQITGQCGRYSNSDNIERANDDSENISINKLIN